MSILVAGATGLVGSAVVRELNASGKPNVGISSKDVDLLDRASTFRFVKDFKPSVVIDAAARVGGIGANNAQPVDFLTQNIQIQSNLMDAAHEAGVKNFVFLGSSCIYPKNSLQPIKEEYLMTGELESTNSAYAIAKIAGLELIKSYRKQFGNKWISIMPTNLYGPNDNFNLENSHVFPALIRKFVEAKETNAPSVTLWGTGTPKREFLHVDDLAKAILICLEKYDSDQHINIGSGEDLSIKDFALKVSKAARFNGEIIWDSTKPDGTPRKVLDVTKIKNLGWKPSISLDEGIIQTIQWYRENK
jgi:GDP-L-fucose synthase